MSQPGGTVFEIFTGDLQYLITDQMPKLDLAMIDDLNIDLVQMIENAGRNLADLDVPPSLYAGPTVAPVVGNIFSRSEIIRLR